jgi:hypothetical protein
VKRFRFIGLGLCSTLLLWFITCRIGPAERLGTVNLTGFSTNASSHYVELDFTNRFKWPVYVCAMARTNGPNERLGRGVAGFDRTRLVERGASFAFRIKVPAHVDWHLLVLALKAGDTPLEKLAGRARGLLARFGIKGRILMMTYPKDRRYYVVIGPDALGKVSLLDNQDPQ